MSWEERMGERARTRREEAESIASQEADDAWRAHIERYVQQYAESLTPVTAQAVLDTDWPACACIGGPLCCRIRIEAAERVLNHKS